MEFFIEFFFEGLIELIGYSYVKVVSWILPKHKFSEKLHKRFKTGILILFVISILTLIFGIGLLTDGDPYEAKIGSYMTFIPLAVIGLQLLLGILAKIITILCCKRREKSDLL